MDLFLRLIYKSIVSKNTSNKLQLRTNGGVKESKEGEIKMTVYTDEMSLLFLVVVVAIVVVVVVAAVVVVVVVVSPGHEGSHVI